jgi:hypothetical protein
VPIKCLRQPSRYQCSKICGGKWDLISDFGKLKNKSVKFKKIWLKRTGDDGGTVKIGKNKMRPVSPINRPVFPENRPIYRETGRILFVPVFTVPPSSLDEFC